MDRNSYVSAKIAEKMAYDEAVIRDCLERWVSGCDPIIQVDRNYNIIGLGLSGVVMLGRPDTIVHARHELFNAP